MSTTQALSFIERQPDDLIWYLSTYLPDADKRTLLGTSTRFRKVKYYQTKQIVINFNTISQKDIDLLSNNINIIVDSLIVIGKRGKTFYSHFDKLIVILVKILNKFTSIRDLKLVNFEIDYDGVDNIILILSKLVKLKCLDIAQSVLLFGPKNDIPRRLFEHICYLKKNNSPKMPLHRLVVKDFDNSYYFNDIFQSVGINYAYADYKYVYKNYFK
jgi:hypothetical protein